MALNGGEPTQQRHNDKKLIEVFACRLVDDLSPDNILPHLTCLTSGEKQRIQNAQDQHNDQKATEILLQCIIDSDEQGAFAEFMNALKNTQGCEHLADLMIGDKEVKCMHPQQNLLSALAPTLVRDIDARTLCEKIPCLNEMDEQQIKNDYDQHGAQRAATTLLYRVVKRGPTWFDELLAALKEDSKHLYDVILGTSSSSNADDNNDDDDEIKAEKELNAGIAAADKIGRSNPIAGDNASSSGNVSNDLNRASADAIELVTGANNAEKCQTIDEDTNVITNNVQCESNTKLMVTLNVDETDTDKMNAAENAESSDKVDEPEEDIVIELRPYQAELVKPSIFGHNVIVSAPTGSGKTRIAAFITLNHLKQRENAKVLLLVNKVPLVEQHYKKEFKLLTSKYKVSKICGESAARVSLKHLVEKNDVVILTAQILENALNNGEDNEKLELTDFSLLIFDECHHTQKGEVYNNIMHEYLKLKIEEKVYQLPQILGLTASLGVGGARTEYKAVTHILQICANLDCMDLRTVQAETKGLEEHNKKPHKVVEVVADREKDPFGDELKKMMKKIHSLIDDKDVESDKCDLGTQVYEQWVTGLGTTAVKKQDRKLRTCAEHLRKYNDALLINDSVRMEDALNYLQEFYDDEERREKGFDSTDKELLSIFEEHYYNLVKISKKKMFENPKLKRLQSQLEKEYSTKEGSRGIIFTKTRESTKALVSWIKNTPDLNFLKVDRLTGTGPNSTSKSMTQKDQQDIILKFHKGDLNCLVATTVAEEGLDIPECNVVIRYNLVTNEIAMVQARGRARAKDSTYTLVAGENSGAAVREQTNEYKESLEKKAIATIQRMSKEDFRKQVKKVQVATLNERKMKANVVVQRRQLVTADRASLFCRKCSVVACNAKELRKIENMHHVNPEDEFKEKYKLEEYPESIEFANIENVGKLLCGSCNKNWGTMIVYDGARLPCISIKNFGLKFNTGVILAPKKWKDVPFEIPALDFTEYLEKILNIGAVSMKEVDDL
ncbi:ATP-dependent RNA helicase DHX58-like [Saccoglossus kowalevskii]|uniref:RNA helicase n=1 Tax=Saccoglossus kowalevskii TaxID=10224 RepID=A0ABM0MLY6_SACKO|nr:PREDICTED: interferon-induced helicase C domain-containing protein 1-like [Saccoglossus kowalevskii]